MVDAKMEEAQECAITFEELQDLEHEFEEAETQISKSHGSCHHQQTLLGAVHAPASHTSAY